MHETRHEEESIMSGFLPQRTCHLKLTEAGPLETLHGTEELAGDDASHTELTTGFHGDAVSNSTYTTVSSWAMPLWAGRGACHAMMGSPSSTGSSGWADQHH